MSLSGWVKKKGGRTGLWHRRFLSISGNTISFAKDAENQVVEQQFALPPETTASLVESPTPRFQIEIPGEEAIVLNTETREMAMRWITAIHSVCST
jgi:hypothetical protein